MLSVSLAAGHRYQYKEVLVRAAFLLLLAPGQDSPGEIQPHQRRSTRSIGLLCFIIGLFMFTIYLLQIHTNSFYYEKR